MAKESDASAPATHREPVIRLRDAELRFGPRVLWHDLDLDVAPGEFLAVLGPNGTGKTSLLKVLLGQNSLSAGTAEVGGRQVHKGNPDIGYIPQQRGIDPHTPMRGRDLVRMGIDGHRWGMGLRSRGRKKKVETSWPRSAPPTMPMPLPARSPAVSCRGCVWLSLGQRSHCAALRRTAAVSGPAPSAGGGCAAARAAGQRDAAVVFVTHEINSDPAICPGPLYCRRSLPHRHPRRGDDHRIAVPPLRLPGRSGPRRRRLVVVGGEEECVDHHNLPDDSFDLDGTVVSR